jgi:peptidoglycan/xylan/chitin deacetylase (PgdA/CDA1 family)
LPGKLRREAVPVINHNSRFSTAEKCGFLAIFSALLLLRIGPYFTIIPLLIFLLLCAAAPFFPNFSFFLPIISKAKRGDNSIALTFDDGPDPATTPVILDLLARHSLQATFFVVGTRAARYPELIKNILDRGHTIGNHSWDHDYFLMFRSIRKLQENIHKTQEILVKSGIQPCVFRPPMGITGSRLDHALREENLIAVNYSCRALDRGNRNIRNLAAKILGKLRPGDIIMLHDLPLPSLEETSYWQKELEYLFGILAQNYTTTSLEEAIGQPVMLRVEEQ